MASVFIKVPVIERLPVGIDYTVVFEDGSMLSDTDIYSHGVVAWLEEIDLPSEEAIRQFANELSQDGVYSCDQEIEAYVEGARFILNHINKCI